MPVARKTYKQDQFIVSFKGRYLGCYKTEAEAEEVEFHMQANHRYTPGRNVRDKFAEDVDLGLIPKPNLKRGYRR
jgi:hypothetical protein